MLAGQRYDLCTAKRYHGRHFTRANNDYAKAIFIQFRDENTERSACICSNTIVSSGCRFSSVKANGAPSIALRPSKAAALLRCEKPPHQATL